MKEQILKLRAEGKTYNEIVNILGCSKGTISYHCGNKGKSKTWNRYEYTKEDLEEAVKNSISINQVIKYLNLNLSGGAYTTLKSKFKKFNIDITHFKGRSWAKDVERGLCMPKENFINKYLKILDKKPHTHTLKLRLYRYGIKKEFCEKCGLDGNWLGRPISLHLDHINGDNKDNRLENLRILCPNCHSQTDTYAGKNIRKIS